MDVTYFRSRRAGPEAAIESAVAGRVSSLFASNDRPLWTAGSLSIGAGMPDLVVMTYEPEVVALTRSEMPITRVLAYLRAVRSARLDTIFSRVGQSRKIIVRCLDELIAARAVKLGADCFSIAPIWKEILPEIVTVEAKVANWQKAVCQASRNRIFAHRSYVALPLSTAERVKDEEPFRLTGLGVLGVSNDESVTLVRESRRHRPRVWSYYYQLAAMAAKHVGGRIDAVQRSNR